MQIDTNPQSASVPSNPPAGGAALPARRPVSARKLEANRRNALKSTGPRTPEGKARSAQNARKSKGPVTVRGKARSSGNATRHGFWSSRTVPADQRPVFRSRLRDTIACFQLNTPIQTLWGVLYTYTQWLLSQLYERRHNHLMASPDLNPLSAAMMFASAESRLERRLVTLLRWRTTGLTLAQLFGVSYAPTALVSAGMVDVWVSWAKRTGPTASDESNRSEPTHGGMVPQAQGVAPAADNRNAPENTSEQSQAKGRGAA